MPESVAMRLRHCKRELEACCGRERSGKAGSPASAGVALAGVRNPQPNPERRRGISQRKSWAERNGVEGSARHAGQCLPRCYTIADLETLPVRLDRTHRPVGTWLSLVEHSLGVRGVGSSNLPVPTKPSCQLSLYKRSLATLGISPAGSRCAYARKTAQVQICPSRPNSSLQPLSHWLSVKTSYSPAHDLCAFPSVSA